MSMTLGYPYSSPSITVTLPNPALGNSLTRAMGVGNKISMNGDNTTTLNSISKTHLLTFRRVTETVVTNLQVLLKAITNSNVEYTDWNSAQYEVIILSNPLEVTEVGTNECGRLFDFTLQLVEV